MVVGRKIESDFPRCLLLRAAAALRFYLLKFSPFFFLGFGLFNGTLEKPNHTGPGAVLGNGGSSLPAPGGFGCPGPRVFAATTAPLGAARDPQDAIRAAKVATNLPLSHAGADSRACSKGDNLRLGDEPPHFVLPELPRQQPHAG